MDFNNNWQQGGSGMQDYGATEPVDGGFGNVGATEPVNNGFANFGESSGFESYGATEPVGGVSDFGATMPGDSGFSSGSPIPDFDHGSSASSMSRQNGSGFASFDPGPTQPSPNGSGFTDFVGSSSSSSNGVEEYGATEPVFAEQIHGFSPVVGWLVCIDGPSKGQDYRIHSGYNSIGRATNMDICVSGDVKISREKHAMVAFDPDGNQFFFGPVDGKNLVKMNGKLVMMPSEMHAYDTLTIGNSKFMFIPFCGEKFSWEEEK